MVFREIFLELGYISQIYFLVMGFLVLGYLLRHFWLHRALFRVSRSVLANSNFPHDKIESHFIGLRKLNTSH